jgi:hypothetical protein
LQQYSGSPDLNITFIPNQEMCVVSDITNNANQFLLLLLQSSDRLAPFHLQLFQAILPIAVQLSAALFLSTCFMYCSPGLPKAFFSPKYCSFKDVYRKLVMPNCMPYP